MPPRSLLQAIHLRVCRVDAWTWIALLFFFHTLGSLVVIRIIRYDVRVFAIPLSLTLLGAAVALLMSWRHRETPSPAWSLWCPLVIYLLHITALSSRTYPGASGGIDSDYFHPIEFFVLALLACRPLWRLLRRRGRLVFFLTLLLIGATFGALDEFHQSFVPGRTCTWLDFGLDLLGTALAGGAYLAWTGICGTSPGGPGCVEPSTG